MESKNKLDSLYAELGIAKTERLELILANNCYNASETKISSKTSSSLERNKRQLAFVEKHIDEINFLINGTIRDVQTPVSGLPDRYELSAAYPNPFNPIVTIPFSLPENSYMRLEIYNILGQRVVTLVDQQMRAGYHKRMWNGMNEAGLELSSGVYFVKMRAGRFHAQRKIVLLK